MNQPISYADIIAIVPHFAARIQFAKDYYEVMGEDDPNYEFLFVGTNPYLGAKVRIGRKDADGPGPRGPHPGRGRHLRGPRRVVQAHGPRPEPAVHVRAYLYKGDAEKGLKLAEEDGTNRAVLDQYAPQRKLGARAPGPAVTIIKKFKDMTDNCIPGGNPYVGGDRDPNYVEYAYIRGGGEIPGHHLGAFPGSSRPRGPPKFAQKVRGDR